MDTSLPVADQVAIEHCQQANEEEAQPVKEPYEVHVFHEGEAKTC